MAGGPTDRGALGRVKITRRVGDKVEDVKEREAERPRQARRHDHRSATLFLITSCECFTSPAAMCYGGIERMLATLAATPSARSHAALRGPAGEPSCAGAAQGLASNRSRRFRARASRPLSVVRARRELRTNLTDLSPDATVFHGSWTHAMFARSRARVRIGRRVLAARADQRAALAGSAGRQGHRRTSRSSTAGSRLPCRSFRTCRVT